jgi:hypothetical protein
VAKYSDGVHPTNAGMILLEPEYRRAVNDAITALQA